MWAVWLIISIIFAITELLYNGFFLIWFSIGALLALFTSLITTNLLIQSIVFLITSLILLLTLTKRATQKFSTSTTHATNTDRLIGKCALVTEPIGTNPLESGLVKLDGEIWTATSQTNEMIPKGATVKVEKIEGVRLIVKLIQS